MIKRPAGVGAASLARAAAEALEGRRLFSADLLVDLSPGGLSSYPARYKLVGGISYFVANDSTHGAELWRTDGTAAGTAMVKDLNPGTASSSPSLFIDFNGTLVFAADTPGIGLELWRSDGTAAGTTLIKDIQAGPTGSILGALSATDAQPLYAVVGNTLFFRAYDSVHGEELWKTDGTAAGTVLVKDIRVGANSSAPLSLTAMGGKVYFAAKTDAEGLELWSSDGTDSGTAIVTDLIPGSVDSNIGFLAATDDTLYFSARAADPAVFRGVPAFYRTDGTAAGTILLKSYLDFDISSIAVAGGNALFTSNGLYGSDGTPGGTQLLTAVDSVGGLTSIAGGHAVFVGRLGSDGTEPYASDGTNAGTFRLADVMAGSSTSTPSPFIRANDGMGYFSADDGILGRQLWRTDGTPTGTTRISSITGGAAEATGYAPILGTLADRSVIFSYAGPTGTELYKLNSAGASALLSEINPIGISTLPTAGAEVNGYYIFATDDGRLYRTDGSADGTVLIKRFSGSNGLGNAKGPRGFVAFGDTVYFCGTVTGNNYPQLWQTDGTVEGTKVSSAPATFVAWSDPVVAGTNLFLQGYTSPTGVELFSLDTSTNTVVLVKDFIAGSNYAPITEMTAVGNQLFFSAKSSSTGAPLLWVTDGTPAGTTTVLSASGAAVTAPLEMTAFKGGLYFIEGGRLLGIETIDPVTGRAVLAYPLPQGLPDYDPQVLTVDIANLTAVGSTLYFTLGTIGTGVELWRTDGTAAGTSIVSDLIPGSAGSSPQSLVASGDTLYYTATTPVTGRELWQVDGSTAVPVPTDLTPGPASSALANFYDAYGLLLFTVDDGTGALSLRSTDGSTGGVAPILNAQGGPVIVIPGTFGKAAGAVYFAATTLTGGTELWRTTDRVPRRLHAEAGGPYSTTEGKQVTLSAFGSTGDITAYEWDFDYSGTFVADASGFTTIFPGRDGPSIHAVALRVTAADGSTRIDTATVSVTNIRPTVQVSGPARVNEGSPYTLALSATDPGEDTISSWTIEWGDGSFSTVAGSVTSVEHQYADGPLTGPIFATATDEDGSYDVTADGVQVGTLDPTFGAGTGFTSLPDSSPRDMLRLPNGKVILLTAQSLVGLTADGQLDSTFGVSGVVGGIGDISRLTLLADGSILAGLDIISTSGVLLRSLSNVSGPVSTVAPDGSFYVASYGPLPTSSPSQVYIWVQHLLQDGTIDPSYGIGGMAVLPWLRTSGVPNVLSVSADGHVTVGGTGSPVYSPFSFVARLLPGGAPDTSFGTDGLTMLRSNNGDTARSFYFYPDGRVLVAGSANSNPGSTLGYPALQLVRLGSNGLPDPTFGSSGTVTATFSTFQQIHRSAATSLAVHASGRIVVSGFVDSSLVVLRYDSAGRLDPSWGDAGVARPAIGVAQSGYSTAMAFEPGGKLLVASAAADSNGWNRTTILSRLTFSPLVAQVVVNNVAPDFDPGLDTSTAVGTALTRGGAFTDPGRDSWSGTVDYGDGTGLQPLTISATGSGPAFASGGQFTLGHAFAAAGVYPVSITIRDDDGGSHTHSFKATVTAPPIVSTTLSIRSVADALVRDGTYANTNYGAAIATEVRKTTVVGSQREAYMRFDLTQVGSAAQITSAKLRLNGRLSTAGAVTLGLYTVASNAWTEAGLKWSNKPVTATSPLLTKSVGSTSSAWVEFDLTSYLKQQKTAGATSVSFAIKGTAVSTPWVIVDSDEATQNRPELRVVQTPPPQAIIVSTSVASVIEGKSTGVIVKLTTQPAGNVVVSVARTAGDGDLSAGPASLTFTPANWSVGQTITLIAAQDVDALNGSATFTLASPGLAPKTFAATELDDDLPKTLRSTADSYVRDGASANSNFGLGTTLAVRKSVSAGTTSWSVLKFDLTQVTSISSATLKLTGRVESTAAASVRVQAYAASTTAWTESGVTWTNRPLTTGASLGEISVVGTTNKAYGLDLTAWLKAQKAGGKTVASLILISPVVTSAAAIFSSDEAASDWPELIVKA